MNRKQVKDLVERAVWTFVQAAGPVFLAGLMDVFNAFQKNGLPAGKAALLALAIGAVAAGVSALKTWLKTVRV